MPDHRNSQANNRSHDHAPRPNTDPNTDPKADIKPNPAPARWPLRRARHALAFSADLALLAALLSWLLGRTISDRHLWSQYLGWIPTEAVACLAVAVLIAGILLRWRRPRLLVTIATLGITAWLAFAEWRVHRFVVPEPARGPLRVLFMNISPRGRDASIDRLFATRPDIAILSNVHPQPVTFEKIYGVRHQDLLERFTEIVPGNAPPGEAHLVRNGMFHIYSKHPIRRRASAYVGNQDTWLDNDIGGGGAVLMLEIDTPQGPVIIWAVDMPRTLGASRAALFAEARTSVDATTRVRTIDPVGRWIASDLEPSDPLRTPDLVVGDFNTPAHAWSVRRFVPATRPARADAGVGPSGTFPNSLPLFEIDLARLGRGVSATHLTRIRSRGCRHLGLVMDITRDRSENKARSTRPHRSVQPAQRHADTSFDYHPG